MSTNGIHVHCSPEVTNFRSLSHLSSVLHLTIYSKVSASHPVITSVGQSFYMLMLASISLHNLIFKLPHIPNEEILHILTYERSSYLVKPFKILSLLLQSR